MSFPVTTSNMCFVAFYRQNGKQCFIQHGCPCNVTRRKCFKAPDLLLSWWFSMLSTPLGTCSVRDSVHLLSCTNSKKHFNFLQMFILPVGFVFARRYVELFCWFRSAATCLRISLEWHTYQATSFQMISMPGALGRGGGSEHQPDKTVA